MYNLSFSFLSLSLCLQCKQLFFYSNMADRMALGVLNLDSYGLSSGKGKEKKYYFRAVPKYSCLKTFNFYAEMESERERLAVIVIYIM